MADSSVLQVVIFRNGSLVGTEVFLPGTYLIGSEASCELALDDPSIAADHAQLTFIEGTICVEDRGGGVQVNGEPITAVEVRPLDDVAVGPFLLKLRVMAQKRMVSPPAMPAAAPPARAPSPAAPPRATSKPAARPASARPTPAPVFATEETLVAPMSPDLVAASRPQAPAPREALAPPAPRERPARPAAPRAQTGGIPAPSREPAADPMALDALLAEAQRDVPTARERAAQREHLDAPATDPGTDLTHLRTETVAAPPRASRYDAEPRTATLAPPSAAIEEPATRTVAPRGAPRAPAPREAVPFLRVRVFWGKQAVCVRGFPKRGSLRAAARETADVPVYCLPLPSRTFKIARWRNDGWVVRVPEGVPSFQLEPAGWRAVEGEPDGKHATAIPLPLGRTLRLGNGLHSVELRADLATPLPKRSWKEAIDPQLGIPLGVTALLALIAVLVMPSIKQEVPPDFDIRKLAPVRAALRPPEKKKEKKKPEKLREDKAEVADKKAKQDPEVVAPKVAKANVNNAIKAVQKLTVAGPAVQSLLKATSKLAGGPKGYGDKGTGFKLSPLIGKPPIAMAGMGFGPGAGGFGTSTKGLGALRGMGGGGGGGIGSFSAGGVGKGKVAGTVVSAPARQAQVRGSLDRELIAKVINEHLQEVRGCYERALLKETGLAGKLVLEWSIDLNGRVSDIRVKQVTLRGPEVPNCIVSSLKGWVFPKPRGGKVVVSYPFIFNSVGF